MNQPTTDQNLERIRWLTSQGRQYLSQSEQPSGDWRLLPWQKSLISQQLELQHRSRRRFPTPERWIWTERGLAQASDWWSAQWKASIFPRDEPVVDACCGAGADLVALAGRGPAIGIDRDAAMTLIAESNVQAHSLSATLQTSSVSPATANAARWLHLDPDRRRGNRRTNVGDQFSPSLADVLEIARAVEGSVIKLAPSTQITRELEQVIDAEMQRCWLGNMGECRQQLLITGTLRGTAPRGRRAVLCEPPVSDVSAEFASPGEGRSSEFVAAPVAYPACVEGPKAYVFDLHPVLHASELHVAWAEQRQMRPIGTAGGFFTSDSELKSPWSQCFKMIDVLAWDDRKIRRWLRQHAAGVVEVKNRLLRLDANFFQRRYSSNQEGGSPISLLVTRMGDRVRAMVCRRIA